MKVWDSNGHAHLLDLLKHDTEIAEKFAPGELEALFDLGYHTKSVDVIFKRIFGQ